MKIEIPGELGEVIPFECLGSDMTVAVIPRMVSADRCVYESEKAVADVLSYLAKNYELRTVFTDGPEIKITRSLVKAFLRKEAAEQEYKNERMTSAGYALAIADYDAELTRTGVKNKEKSEPSPPDTAFARIDDKGHDFYLDAAQKLLKDGMCGVEYFLATTDHDVFARGTELGDFFYRHEGVADDELRRNLSDANLAVDSIEKAIGRVIKVMFPGLIEFDKVVERYESGRMRIDKFFFYLERKAEKLKISIEEEFPHFYRAVEAFRKNPTELVSQPALSEQEALEMRINGDLCAPRGRIDKDDIELIEAYENIGMIKDIINHRASPEIVRELRQMRTRFSSLYFESVLSKWGEEVPKRIEIIDDIVPQMEHFYNMAFAGQRFGMLEIGHYMKDRKERFAAAVITGSNTDGVIATLLEQRISAYKVVPRAIDSSSKTMPRIDVISDSQNPLKLDILTREEEEAFEELFPEIAADFMPVGKGCRGAYKKVIELRRNNPLRRLALKIADIRDPKLSDRAKKYLEKAMEHGEHKSYKEVLEAEAKRAKKLAKSGNRHISRILDAGEWSDTLFLFLEEYSKDTLKDYVEVHRQLSPIDVMSIAEQLANGLGAMHSIGMYHGDLKPENILFRNGIITITDFGLTSSLPDENGLSIFNETAAPEIIAGDPHTPQSDIWSYGVDLFFTRTKEFPFPISCLKSEWKQMPYEERRKHVNEHILGAIMDYRRYNEVVKRIYDEFDSENFGKMAKIVRRCLSTEPGKRFRSGKFLYRAVKAISEKLN